MLLPRYLKDAGHFVDGELAGFLGTKYGHHHLIFSGGGSRGKLKHKTGRSMDTVQTFVTELQGGEHPIFCINVQQKRKVHSIQLISRSPVGNIKRILSSLKAHYFPK